MLFINGLGADTSSIGSRLTSGSQTSTPSPAPTSTPLPLRARASSFGPATRPGVASDPRFVPITIVPQYTCSSSGCVPSNEPTRNLFKAVQALIELVARKKGWTPSNWWGTTPQTGVIDSRTASNYLIIVNSGAPFGPMIDARVDAKLVASFAAQFANTMAQWLGVPVPMPASAPPSSSRVPLTPLVTPPPPTTTAPPPPIMTAPPPPQVEVPQHKCPDGSTVLPGQACPPLTPSPTPPPPTEASPPPTALVTTAPTTPTPEAAPSTAKYREGCVARFNKTRRIFSIYCPVETALGYAYYDNLADTLLTPSAEPAPAGMIKEGEELTIPTCATASGEAAPCPKTPDSERDKGFFRLHNPWMWVTLAGVAGVVGGTGYVVYRRRSQTRSRPNQW